MKNGFVTVHGHFYQPPRENPWLEVIESEESAHPFHDWNERITFECYRPNAHARIMDPQGKILQIINNYSFMSFNFGPTLLSYLELKFPSVYQRVIEADRESLRRLGHGNAIAQVYHHVIMPLANRRDQETEVWWGMADFERRFHRRPEAIWLPETAVSYLTLQVLVQYGIRYLILSPFQALRIRPFGRGKWAEVSSGEIDSTQPYRCFIREESGKKLSDQFIDIFFYNGVISREVGFGELLKDANTFCEQFKQTYQSQKQNPQLIHIATDGETYGHHKKFGEMALAFALKEGFASRGLELTNYGAYLKRFPPVYEVEINEGPKGEGTSWSCAHGVGRWKEDCGCSTGGRTGWNQKWRKPLRESLELLRDDLTLVFEKEGKKIFKDVWKARDGYIEVILDRSPGIIHKFFEQYGYPNLDEGDRIKGLKLMEMQRYALQMFTSCGWFFADLAGLETILILQHGARAIQLAEEFGDRAIETKFLSRLSEAKSNLPEMGRGDQVYQRFVKPRCVTLDKIVNHYAISSLLDGEEREKKIFSYRVERINYERMEGDNTLLALGHVKVTSVIVPESKEFIFGVIPSVQDMFRTWVSEYKKEILFDRLKEKGADRLGRNEEEMAHTLTSLLGNLVLTFHDILREERQVIFQKLMKNEMDRYVHIRSELFEKMKPIIGTFLKEGLEIPEEVRDAAGMVLSDQLLYEIKQLKVDFKKAIEKGEIPRIVKEAEHQGIPLRKKEPILILSEMSMEKMRLLREIGEIDLNGQEKRIEEMITLLDLIEKCGFEVSKEEVQDFMGEMLEEYVLNLERSWWGDGIKKPFPSALIVLAERMGFNVARFSKMIPPALLKGQPS